MALPVALFAMIAGMALVSAAVAETINVQQGSHRDASTKSAIAVADAGANIARSRIDRYAVVLATHQCLKLGSSGVLEGATAESDGWCPAVTGTVGGGKYSYRASPAGSTCGEYKLCVVATGTVGEASRRVEVAYGETAVEETKFEKTEGKETGGEKSSGTNESGSSPFVEGLIGEEGVEIGGSADIRVGVGTNGDVVQQGNGAKVCGDVRHGVGKKNGAKQCAGYTETEENKTMPPVSSFMPSDIATNNSDYRLVACTKTHPTQEPAGCELDSFTGHRKSTYPWYAGKRAISIGGNDVLTVNGGDYWVCSLELGGTSQLIMGASARVRFFFDTPEHCGLSPGATQLSLGGNTRITSTNASVFPAFYFLGSSNVSLAGNAGTDELVVYGRETTINVTGNATFKGVLAGKKVFVTGNGHIEDDTSYRPPAEIAPVTEKTEPKEKEPTNGQTHETKVTTARYYSPQFYVECTGPAPQGAAPNSNC
jgi:hypothetical protein